MLNMMLVFRGLSWR